MIELRHWWFWRWILRRPRLLRLAIAVVALPALTKRDGFRETWRLLPAVHREILRRIDRDLEALDNELGRLHRLRYPQDFKLGELVE